MSDYGDFGKICVIFSTIVIITIPLWLPIYGAVWIFKHEEWKEREIAIELSRRKEQERIEEIREFNRIANENKIKDANSKEKMEEIKNKILNSNDTVDPIC